jgi:hypothetical protein
MAAELDLVHFAAFLFFDLLNECDYDCDVSAFIINLNQSDDMHEFFFYTDTNINTIQINTKKIEAEISINIYVKLHYGCS